MTKKLLFVTTILLVVAFVAVAAIYEYRTGYNIFNHVADLVTVYAVTDSTYRDQFFHEITHAVQFTGVPWLREHLASLLRELLSSVKVEVDLPTKSPIPSVSVKAMPGSARALLRFSATPHSNQKNSSKIRRNCA